MRFPPYSAWTTDKLHQRSLGVNGPGAGCDGLRFAWRGAAACPGVQAGPGLPFLLQDGECGGRGGIQTLCCILVRDRII
jgi:hypothetical protein